MDTNSIIALSGTVILLLLSVMAYFIKIVHNDVRTNTVENGRLKGRLELIDQKSNSDIKHLQETTQMEISTMSGNISELSKNVNKLVMALAKRNIIDERNQEE